MFHFSLDSILLAYFATINKKMKKITIIALILGSIFTAYSQETQKEVSRDLTVEREYDPTVVNAKKISPTPQKEVVEVEQPEITYTTWSKVEKTDKTRVDGGHRPSKLFKYKDKK